MKYLIQILKPKFYSSNRLALTRCYATNKTDEFSSSQEENNSKEDNLAFDIIGNIPEAEELSEREQEFRERVERMRDVSRFSKLTARNKYKNTIPTFGNLEEASYIKNDPKYFRKVYAKHGKVTGIEAGLAWPNKLELNELVKRETELELSLEQKVKLFIERKLKEVNAVEKM